MRQYKTFSNTPYSQRRKAKKGRRNLILSILLGVFLMYAFINWIMPTFVGSLSVFNRLKPTPSTDAPIADSVILAPPVLNIPYEATATANIRVSGFASDGLSVEIYNNDSKVSSTKAQTDGSFISDSFRLKIGQNSIYGMTVDDQNNSSLPSKNIYVSYISEKPKLDLTSPSDGQEIRGDKKVTVSGTTNPNNSIFINSLKTIVSGDGSFSQSINLSDGPNTITVSAVDNVGQTTQQVRNVNFVP